MAISNNPLMTGVRGHIGKQVVYRKHGDKTIVCAYPDMSNRKLSKAQKKQNNVMKTAHAEVRKIKANDKLRIEAQLRLNVPREKLHQALLKEQMLKLTRPTAEAKITK